MAAPLEYVRSELFDEAVDRHHCSYVSVVLGGPLGTIRCRTTRTFLARFANVPRNDHAPAPYVPFVDTHGPTWTWIQQFSVRDSNSYFQRLYAF
jgi:hypothetical protein